MDPNYNPDPNYRAGTPADPNIWVPEQIGQEKNYPKETGVDTKSESQKNPFYGWTAPQLASALHNGMTAGDLESAINAGYIDPTMARDAQIMKDSWPHGGWGWAGFGNLVAAQANPSIGNDPAWQAWYNQLAALQPADLSQPTLSWAPRALPAQYRQQAETWLRGQGYTPSGSLGQYGYTQYQRPSNTGQTAAMPFTSDSLNALSDPGLRRWLEYFLSVQGLMPGNYPRPE